MGVVLLAVCQQTACAQGSFRDDFDKFTKRAHEEYEQFRKQAFLEYTEFVREAWKEFGAEPPVPVPEEVKVQPVLAPDADAETASWFTKLISKLTGKPKAPGVEETAKPKKQQKELTYKAVIRPEAPVVQPGPKEGSVIEKKKGANEYRVFDVFGTECKVRIGENCRFRLKGVNSNAVADAMKVFVKDQFDNLLYDCLQERARHDFSDWAYYQMLTKITDEFYGKQTNEATLALAFLYSQTGYKMRLAHDNAHLYMLAASRHYIYGKPFFVLDGARYYILDGRDSDTMLVCQASFPKESSMSLQISAVQRFGRAPMPVRTIRSKAFSDFTFTLSSNKNYMDFYDTYPSSCVNDNFMTRWAMYSNTPLEEGVREQLYPMMQEKIKGMTHEDAVQHMLNWVQTGFEYEYDDVVWGHDRAFFGEETLFYPYCDCEDRSILLSHLVRDLLGLDVILVYYPGHLAMAVEFDEEVEGDYIMLDGKRFVICDPTYIGAPIGDTMPGCDNQTSTVILLQKSV